MFRLLIKIFVYLLKLLDKKKGKFYQIGSFHLIDQYINKNIVVDDIIFDASSSTQFKRANMFLNKEPDTLEWIRTYIKKNDIFYDIGACVGEYSLYAAKKCGARVYAFEPSALNYSIINNNIYLNRLDKEITALNIAINNKNIVSYLKTNRSSYLPGKSHNQFEKSINEVDNNNESDYLQSCIGLSIDYLIDKFDLPFPNHIKIDVDGNEHLILNGMQKSLNNKKLKSIACELDLDIPDHKNIISLIESCGFKCTKDFDTNVNDQSRILRKPYRHKNYFFISKVIIN